MESISLQNAVEELSQGWEWANQLKSIIDEPFGNDRSVEADHLIRKILRLFADTISILNSRQVSDRIPPDTGVYSDGRQLGDSVRRRISSSELKHGTVFSNKGKTPYLRTKITTDLPYEDGCKWRRYGQKNMLGAKYPRSYYRCPLRHDLGCQATKQVQRIKGDPPMFETTYRGHHACNQLGDIPLENSTTPANSNSPRFRMDSSNSSQVNDDPSYPTSTSTKTNKPPLIIFSYLT